MKRITTLLLLLSFISFSFSQEFEPPEMRFGKGIKSQLEQEDWEIVNGDAAIILFAKSDYSFKIISENLGLVETYHFRIKVLSNDGLDHANIKLKYRTYLDEKIVNIKGFSYNLENGKIVETKLDKKQIFHEKLDDYFSSYSLAIPNVKVGSVFEYTYTVRKPSRFRPSRWYFNGDIPVLYSQNQFNVPEWFHYQEHQKGFTRYVINSEESTITNLGSNYGSADSKIHTLAKYNLPAFQKEDFIPNINAYRDQHQYRLEYVQFPNSNLKPFVRSWEGINYSLLANHYDELFKDKQYINEIVNEQTAGIDEKEEIIKKLYEYVVNNIEVVYRGWIFQSQNQKQLLKNGEGNIADANLLLVNLLITAGIDASPLLISTRDEGYLDYANPDPSSFSYPVVYVRYDGKEILMNASSNQTPFNIANQEDYNLNAWLLSPSNPNWVNTEIIAPTSNELLMVEAQILEDGSLEGQIFIQSKGFLSLEDKKQIENRNLEEVIKAKVSPSAKNLIELSDYNHSSLNDKYELFEIKTNFKIQNYAKSIGDNLYLNPFILCQIEENPFSDEIREYPIDFPFPKSQTLTLKIKYPEGYQVDELPSPIRFKIDNSTKALITFKEMNGVIHGTVKLSWLKTFFAPDEYLDLKAYVDKVIEEMGKQVTLVKKQ